MYLKTNPEQPIFKMQEITIGQQIGEQYEVLDGLKRGDEIVTNGTFTVDASAQLKGKKSMMNKRVGKQAQDMKDMPWKWDIQLKKLNLTVLLKNHFDQ